MGKDKNATTYHDNSVTTFQDSNVKTFQDKFKDKNATAYQDNNAEMYQDKFVNKLVTAVNNFFDTVKENSEQSHAIITSPISIMMYQSYVIFILMSTFGLKHNLVN